MATEMKPSLGVIPELLHETARALALISAVKRYMEDEQNKNDNKSFDKVNMWLKELSRRIERIEELSNA